MQSRPSPARALVALLCLAVLAACGHRPPEVTPAPSHPAAPAARSGALAANAEDAALLRSRELMVPVSGVAASRIPDTFAEARDGARRHNAVDILAPRGTAVLSADSGFVYRVSSNRLGGLTVYAMDPARRLVYYYAHLDRYADSLRAGMPLAKGQVIGYVGTTGNAPPDTPHLHFQVMRLDDPKRYWDGTPLDPRPWFVATGRQAPASVATPVSLSIKLPAPATPAARKQSSRAAGAAVSKSRGRAATP